MKKKNNIFKKLIPAAGMLLLSTAMLATSTYAWFSMSKTVTATGMEVTAKTDSIFLEIAGSEDSNYTTFGLTGTDAIDAQLYPSHHEAWSGLADINDFTLSGSETENNWYFRYNANANNATNAMSEKTYIDDDVYDFGDYVATATFQVRLHPGSAATGYDLYVSGITIAANKGITVVIAGANGYKEFSASADNITFNAADILSNTVTTTAQTITAYIYINGDDEHVYTDNITNLTGAVSFQLSAFETDQNPNP